MVFHARDDQPEWLPLTPLIWIPSNSEGWTNEVTQRYSDFLAHCLISNTACVPASDRRAIEAN